MIELEKQVRAQQAKVEKVGSLLLEVGASEYLTDALRQEEERLRAVRGKLAEAARRQATPEAKLAVQEVAAVVRDIAALAETDPTAARQALAQAIEPVVMHPTPEGYDIEVALRNVSAGPVAQAGRVREYHGCGGLLLPSTNRTLDSTFCLPKLRAALFAPDL